MKQILLLAGLMLTLSACETRRDHREFVTYTPHRSGPYVYEDVYLGPRPFVGPRFFVNDFGGHHHHGHHHRR